MTTKSPQSQDQAQELKLDYKIANHISRSKVWDCESSLYDSFELKSFKRQLDSAIIASSSERTLSMPHLPDRRVAPPPLPTRPLFKKPSKFSRSIQKLIRSIFGGSKSKVQELPYDSFYVHDKSNALYAIPEVQEMDYAGLSPELNSYLRKTASERFTATSIGVSCG